MSSISFFSARVLSITCMFYQFKFKRDGQFCHDIILGEIKAIISISNETDPQRTTSV